MSEKTGIQWTDTTWNPVRGCSRISEGCRHCYAERVAARYAWPSRPSYIDRGEGRDAGPFNGFARDGKWTGRVELVPDKLAEPLSWRKPRRVFVNNMSDLFHESLPDEAIDRVFAVMALAPHLTFQVLTKRAERMRRYFKRDGWRVDDIPVPGARQHIYAIKSGDRIDVPRIDPDEYPWPLPNVWLGVSVENPDALHRLDDLARTPAAVRFVSAEPLIEDLGSLARWLHPDFDSPGYRDWPDCTCVGESAPCDMCDALGPRPLIDWMIVGGESGPRARPCDVAWIRSIVAQCKAAGVAVFVKQLGARPMMRADSLEGRRSGDHPEREWPEGTRFGTASGHMGTDWQGRFVMLRDRKGGDPAEWPADLRVREMPEVAIQ